MNLSNCKGSMSNASSSAARKPAETVSDQFPAGLRVLVVDDDPTCLMILEKMLTTCLYQVTKCTRAEMALSLLRENRNGYDVVLSDVHMPDMDGFKLLEHIGLEMDLPVIMMSADDGKNVVMKGVTHGACDYLIKPVRIEALRNIWQHVVRKKRNEWKDVEQSGSFEEGGDRGQKQSEDADYSSSANEGNWRNSKRRKDEDDDVDEREDSSTLKKPRVVWSVELHQQFVQAVNQLGIDKAVPKKILEMMNVPGLTRENVASHLQTLTEGRMVQKYRLYLRRLSGVSQHPNGMSNGYVGPKEAAYGPLSSLNGIDLHALAASGQLPAQSLATLQAAGLARQPVKSRIPVNVVDQRNLFSFENPKLRFENGQLPQQQQQQQQLLSNSKQMNLLHGIPVLTNAISGGIGTGATGYDSISQPSPAMNFPLNAAATNYDIFSDSNHQKSHEWELDSLGTAFGASQRNNAILSNHGFAQNGNLSGAGKPMFSARDATNHVQAQYVDQNMNNFFGSDSVRVKSEFVPFPEQYDQDDLMSALLKQHQGSVGPAESEFDFDGYPLDNVPV